jgi:zinc transport system substrate-binding protein
LATRLSALLLAAAALAAAATGAAAEPAKVVVTVTPVHSLIAGVMKEAGRPDLLLRRGGSPHAYTLRPSDARMLAEADVIFWIGEELETFLAKPLRVLARKARIVELGRAPGVVRLAAREAGAWKTPGAGEEAPGHGASDPHYWLDPENAKAIVRAGLAAMGAEDPANAETYRANAGHVIARIDALDAELRAALAPVRTVAYVVFHDAYRYFERRYGLNALGSITVHPERKPGVRRIRDARRRIRALGARCVFSEPQFEPRLAATLIEGTGVRTAVLDPLGADLAAGPDAYFTLMRDLAASLKSCLAGAP